MTIHAATLAPCLRPLASALVAVCAASAATRDPDAASAFPQASTNIVVDNCNDSGSGSLRAALSTAVSGDAVDLTQLNARSRWPPAHWCSGSSTSGWSGRTKLTIDGGNSGAALYHLGNGTLTVSGISIINGQKYRSDGDVAGACVHANSNRVLESVAISHCKTIGGGNRPAYGGAV